jgi:hypothetical protein
MDDDIAIARAESTCEESAGPQSGVFESLVTHESSLLVEKLRTRPGYDTYVISGRPGQRWSSPLLGGWRMFPGGFAGLGRTQAEPDKPIRWIGVSEARGAPTERYSNYCPAVPHRISHVAYSRMSEISRQRFPISTARIESDDESKRRPESDDESKQRPGP